VDADGYVFIYTDVKRPETRVEGGLGHFHRNPVSSKRRQKGNQVSNETVVICMLNSQCSIPSKNILCSTPQLSSRLAFSILLKTSSYLTKVVCVLSTQMIDVMSSSEM
jgi:hypothetical protein